MSLWSTSFSCGAAAAATTAGLKAREKVRAAGVLTLKALDVHAGARTLLADAHTLHAYSLLQMEPHINLVKQVQ